MVLEDMDRTKEKSGFEKRKIREKRKLENAGIDPKQTKVSKFFTPSILKSTSGEIQNDDDRNYTEMKFLPAEKESLPASSSTKRSTESSDETLSTESPLIHPEIHNDEGIVDLRIQIFGSYIEILFLFVCLFCNIKFRAVKSEIMQLELIYEFT